MHVAYGKYTVVLETGGIRYKICKVWFGRDGTYYVSSPYHSAQKAALIKMPVNYSRQEMLVPYEEIVDIASVDDDEKRLKLAHHPDGFIQFSGQGILSGKDSSGVIRGMGVMSWPLDAPMRGPAFGITVKRIEEFARADAGTDIPVVFTTSELMLLPGKGPLVLEGHYLPALWRRFVRVTAAGESIISVVHPAGAVIPLKAILPTSACERQGFLGLELYTLEGSTDDGLVTPDFSLSSATGNVRKNLEGEILAEGLHAMYPRSTLPVRRVLDYVMNEIPPDGRMRSGPR